MASLTKAYSKLPDWAILTVIFFAILIFGGVFIAATIDVSDSLVTDANYSTNITTLGNSYFTASSELSNVAIVIIGFLILAALLVILFFFIQALKKGGESGGDVI